MKSLNNVLVDASTARKAKKVFHILKRFGQSFTDQATSDRLSGGSTGNRFFFLAFDESNRTWGYAVENLRPTDVIQPIVLRNRLAKELLYQGALIVVKLNEDPSIEVLVRVKYVSSPKGTEHSSVSESEDLTIGIYEDGQFILSPERRKAILGNTVRVSEFCRFANFNDIVTGTNYKARTEPQTHMADAFAYALTNIDYRCGIKINPLKTQPFSQVNRAFFGWPFGGTTAGKIHIDETKKFEDLLADVRKQFDEFTKENGTGSVDGLGQISRKHFFTFDALNPEPILNRPVLIGRTFDFVKDFLSREPYDGGLESILKEFPLPPFSKILQNVMINKPTSPWPEIGSLCEFWDGTMDEPTNKSVGILTHVEASPFRILYTSNNNLKYQNARKTTPELAKQFIIK